MLALLKTPGVVLAGVAATLKLHIRTLQFIDRQQGSLPAAALESLLDPASGFARLRSHDPSADRINDEQGLHPCRSPVFSRGLHMPCIHGCSNQHAKICDWKYASRSCKRPFSSVALTMFRGVQNATPLVLAFWQGMLPAGPV